MRLISSLWLMTILLVACSNSIGDNDIQSKSSEQIVAKEEKEMLMNEIVKLKSENQTLTRQVADLKKQIESDVNKQPSYVHNSAAYISQFPSLYLSPFFSVRPDVNYNSEYHLNFVQIVEEFHKIIFQHVDRVEVLPSDKVKLVQLKDSYDPNLPYEEPFWIWYEYDDLIKVPLSHPLKDSFGIESTTFGFLFDKNSGEMTLNVYLSEEDTWAVYSLKDYSADRLVMLSHQVWENYSKLNEPGEP